MAITTKELSTQLEEVTTRLRALESGQHVMTSSPGLPLQKWNDHGFVHRHEIKPLVRAINNGGGSTAELEERIEGLESGFTGLTSSMSSATSAITDIYGAIRANTTYPSFADIPTTSLGVFTVGGSSAEPIADSPYPNYRGLWTVEQRGVSGYLYQEATQILSDFQGYSETWTRIQNDNSWSAWKLIPRNNLTNYYTSDFFESVNTTTPPFRSQSSTFDISKISFTSANGKDNYIGVFNYQVYIQSADLNQLVANTEYPILIPKSTLTWGNRGLSLCIVRPGVGEAYDTIIPYMKTIIGGDYTGRNSVFIKIPSDLLSTIVASSSTVYFDLTMFAAFSTVVS